MLDLIDYPTDPEENVLFRAQVMELCEERDGNGSYTKQALEWQNAVVNQAAVDKYFFFNMCLWTYDPRPDHPPADKPFCTFDRQDDYLRWLDKVYELDGNQSGFADKARDVGCSWVTIGWGVHHWLFDDSFDMLMGSRKEDLVDKRDNPDCLFYKAEYIIKTLPKWMLPQGFKIKEHRKHMLITNPKNSNTITGESANTDFGRGGRYSFTFLDEFGFWQFARGAWTSCGESAHFRLAVTTPPPTGKASYAYKLKTQQAGHTHIFTFDYNAVPWKNDDWVKAAKDGKSKEEFEREIMRSYDTAIEGKVYAKEWSLNVKQDQFLEYNPLLPLYLWMDFGLDGTGMIWMQKDFRKNWLYIIESYMNPDQPIQFFIPFITGEIGQANFEYGRHELGMINRHREWKKLDGFHGDPDAKKRAYTDEQMRSVRDILAAPPHKLYVQSHKWSDWTHYSIKQLVIMSFSRTTINPHSNDFLIDSMLGSRYPEVRENSQSTADRKAKPVHDLFSHLRTAYEYGIINEQDISPEYEQGYHPAGTDHDAQEQTESVGDDLSFSTITY